MTGITHVFEIRKGVFALGRQGAKAKAVAKWSKAHNGYIGVRGVRPTIGKDSKTYGASKTLREKLAELAN